MSDETVLTTRAYSPFDSWSDWYPQNDDVMITFKTINDYLINEYKIDRSVESLTAKIGVTHETNYNNDEKYSDVFNILIPRHTLSEELCREAVEHINNEYGFNIKLELKDEQVVNDMYSYNPITKLNNNLKIKTYDNVLFEEWWNQNIGENVSKTTDELLFKQLNETTVDIRDIRDGGFYEDIIIFNNSYMIDEEIIEYSEQIKGVTEQDFVNADLNRDNYKTNNIITD